MAGLPRTIKINSNEVTEAMAEPLSSIVGVAEECIGADAAGASI